MFIPVTQRYREDFMTLCREFYGSPAVLHPVPEKYFSDTFDSAVAGSPYVKAYIIEHEGRAEGYLLLALTYSLEAGGLVVLLEDIYVRESVRGKGIGKAAFEFIHKTFPDMKRLRLELMPENRGALALYEKMGMEKLDYLQMIRDC